MSQARTDAQPSTGRPLLALSLLLAAVFAVSAVTAWKAVHTDRALAALTARVAALDERVGRMERSPFVSGGTEAFDEAISKGIERYAARRREAARKALYDRYRAAPEQVSDGRWVYGNPDARFTLIEYGDYECPYCKRFHGTPKAIVDGSKGRANWQWRHLPLSFHNPAARREALAAECAGELGGNRAFWVFSELIFQRTGSNGRGVPDLAAIARDAGIDVDAFRACMRSGRHLDKVNAEAREAAGLGITGTPTTVIVDNKTGRREIVRGAQPAQAVLAVIRKMLAMDAAGRGSSQGTKGSQPAPATAAQSSPEPE